MKPKIVGALTGSLLSAEDLQDVNKELTFLKGIFQALKPADFNFDVKIALKELDEILDKNTTFYPDKFIKKPYLLGN